MCKIVMSALRTRTNHNRLAWIGGWIGIFAVVALVGRSFVTGAFAQSPATGSRGPTGPSPDCIPCGFDGHYCYPNCGPTPPPPPPPPSYTVTARVFENYSSDTEPSDIEICDSAGACQTLSNGQSATVQSGYDTADAVNVASGWSGSQWATSAGTLPDGNTGNSVVLDLQGPGTLALIMATPHTTTWAGYVFSPNVAGTSVTSVSGQFQIIDPSSTLGSQWTVGLWVGIGGIGSNLGLWQAGIAITNTGSGTIVIQAFYEAVGPGCAASCQPVPGSMTVNYGDTIGVYLNSSGGLSSFTIQDKTNLNQWSGSVDFTPYAYSADWILEPTGTIPKFGDNFTNMNANGGGLSLINGFYASFTSTNSPSLLSASGGAGQFQVNG